MVGIPQTFNTSDLPDTGGSSVLIPQADYQALIVESELKQTKSGTGQMLVFKIVITQGQYANTEFVERLNIINQNQTAVEIAYKTLARMSEALGMSQTPADSSQLHNKPLMIRVETEPAEPYIDNNGNQKPGKDKSVIKTYLPLPAGGAGAAPVGAAPAAVTASAPPAPAVAAAPAASPFAPPAAQQQTAAPAPAPVANPFAPPAS